MWEQLRLIREGSVSEDELERARRFCASRWARQLETTEGQAAYLAEWENVGGWHKGEEYYDAFMRLSAANVMDVAQRYLTLDRAGVVVYRPTQAPTVAADTSAMRHLLEIGAVAPLQPSDAGACRHGHCARRRRSCVKITACACIAHRTRSPSSYACALGRR